jgi:predicted ATPase/class 3 adenylate cyclase
MSALPTGIVTFLFTDIEGSTRLLAHDPKRYGEALLRHDELLRAAITSAKGEVFETVGDAFYAAFSDPLDALSAALTAQRSLLAEPWEVGAIKARMAIDCGPVENRGAHYFGAPLYRCARLMALGRGGQTLVAGQVADAVQGRSPVGATLAFLGNHALKDIPEAERVFELRHPDLPHTFGRLRTTARPPMGLPVEDTTLIGRREETEAIEKLLERVRLVTLVGPGGTGKTRLALHVATRATQRAHEGVGFVPLAHITDQVLVPSAIAAAIGMTEREDATVMEALVTYLSAGRTLLVLDNLEQLHGAADVVGELLRRCPDLTLLATSRVALHVSGEQVYEVPPLPVSNESGSPSRPDAVVLFLERAFALRPELVLDTPDLDAVTEICLRLDGLPLAIELAASRSRELPPRALLARLNEKFTLLRGGPHDRPDRQRSLRDTIRWSFDLLSDRDRALMGHLATFAGGFTLEAATAVAGDVGDNILDRIGSLLDHSLIRSEVRPDGMPRFSMLATIREYALDVRDQVEAEGAADRHARYFAALSQSAGAELHGEHELDVLRSLDEETDNIRVALTWLADRNEMPELARSALAVVDYWMLRGRYEEAQWFDRLLPLEDELPIDLRIRIRIALSRVLASIEDHDRARALAEDAMRIAERTGDRAALADALDALGGLEYVQKRPAAAQALFEKSLAIVSELGIRGRAPEILAGIGFAARDQGDTETAAAALDRAVREARAEKDGVALAQALLMSAELELVRKNHSRSEALFEEVLGLSKQVGSVWRKAVSHFGLTLIALREGRLEEAREYCAEAVDLSRQHPSRRLRGTCLAIAADVLMSRVGAASAARLLGAIGRARELEFGPYQSAFDDALAGVREEMEAASLQRALDEGAALSQDEALAEASRVLRA